MKLTMPAMKTSERDEWHLRYCGGGGSKTEDQEKKLLKIKYRRRIFPNGKGIGELWDNVRQSNARLIGVYEREEKNHGQTFSKLNDNYKTTNPRSTMKPNLKKHE